MKFAVLILLSAVTSTCCAADLATELTVARIDYDLPAFEQPKAKASLSFRIFIRQALSDDGFAVEGTLLLPENGEAGGSLSLVEKDAQERKRRTFVLTHAQAREVFSWFSDAGFLDPKVVETNEAPLLDGDEMHLEGFVGSRYFRVRRNSGDSPASAAFIKRVVLFRTWTEEPNQTSEPTPSGVAHR